VKIEIEIGRQGRTLSHQSQFSLTIEAAQCLVAATAAQDDSRRWLKGCALAARADELNQVPSPCSLCSLIRSTDACRCRTPLVRTLARRLQQVGARPLRSAAVPRADAARTRSTASHFGPVRIVRGPRTRAPSVETTICNYTGIPEPVRVARKYRIFPAMQRILLS
jgi:hypothetical protein